MLQTHSRLFNNDLGCEMLQTILIVILILVLLGGIGSLPTWSHSRNWGYGPTGGLSLIGVILLVLLIMLLTGRL
jgi:hypothetical protein